MGVGELFWEAVHFFALPDEEEEETEPSKPFDEYFEITPATYFFLADGDAHILAEGFSRVGSAFECRLCRAMKRKRPGEAIASVERHPIRYQPGEGEGLPAHFDRLVFGCRRCGYRRPAITYGAPIRMPSLADPAAIPRRLAEKLGLPR